MYRCVVAKFIGVNKLAICTNTLTDFALQLVQYNAQLKLNEHRSLVVLGRSIPTFIYIYIVLSDRRAV